MHSVPNSSSNGSGRLGRLRTTMFRKLAAFGHSVIDMAVADEIDADETAGTGPENGGARAGFDSIEEDSGFMPAAGLRAFRVPVQKAREYPMGLTPPEPSLLGLRPHLRIEEGTGDDAGKKFLVMDKLEASPEILAMLDNHTVQPGATVLLTGRPQVIFRPELISIEKELAPSFMIADFKIGKNSQFVSAAAIMAEDFASGSHRGRLKFDTAQVSMDITIVLRNISDKPLRAPHVTIYGPAVE